MKKWKRKTSAIMKITCAFLILISCFGIINLFTATTTLSNIEEAWDGVEVATSFSGGNGTKENPYQIEGLNATSTEYIGGCVGHTGGEAN